MRDGHPPRGRATSRPSACGRPVCVLTGPFHGGRFTGFQSFPSPLFRQAASALHVHSILKETAKIGFNLPSRYAEAMGAALPSPHRARRGTRQLNFGYAEVQPLQFVPWENQSGDGAASGARQGERHARSGKAVPLAAPRFSRRPTWTEGRSKRLKDVSNREETIDTAAGPSGAL